MEIFEDQKDASLVLDKFRKEEREGIHVSDLLFCPRKTYLQKKGLLPPSDEELLYWVIGKGYHSLLEGEISEVQLQIDGVIGTLDTIQLEGNLVVPVEFKSTRASSRREVLEMSHWIEQCLAYAKICGVSQVRLRILYLMGDYRELKPQLKSFILKFTEEEVENFWTKLLSRKHYLQFALENSSPPPPQPKYDWECQRCPERKTCEGLRKKEHDGKNSGNC